MPYPVSVGNDVTVLHRVGNLPGTGTVSGQASALAYVLRDPAGVETTTGIAWTDQGATGFCDGARNINQIGNWWLRVTNPANPSFFSTGSDAGTYEYQIACVLNAAGAAPSGTFLTTVANLKEYCRIQTGSDEDNTTMLLNLIARSTQRLERIVGRALVQASYTEYVDGDGSSFLNLRRGPLQSITSVSSVTYSASGAETATPLAAGDYFARGLASENWPLAGWVEGNGWAFTPGRRNYKVVYSAGYSAVPYDLEQSCIELAAWWLYRHRGVGLVSLNIGDGSRDFLGADDLERKLRSELDPYVTLRVA